MYKKIFISALLCLFSLSSAANAQYYTTIDNAIVAIQPGQHPYLDVYLMIPSNANSSQPSNYYIAFFIMGNVNGQILFFVSSTCVIEQNSSGYYRASNVGYAIPVIREETQAVENMVTVTPYTSSNRAFLRSFYSKSSITSYFNAYNTAFQNIPWSLGSYVIQNTLQPLPSSYLNADTDGGGMSDWDEVFRDIGINPPGSTISDWTDDKPCECGSCCTCTCTCGYRGFPKAPNCGGTKSDCACHDICLCGACCSCTCVCGKVWSPLCGGTDLDCACHACTCGAGCEHCCTCGNFVPIGCDGTKNDCQCHKSCTCGACCSCTCSCGDWTGPQCNVTGGAGGCECHTCSCGAGCHHCCVCGYYTPTTCGGTPSECDCHKICTCGACCQCRCTCGFWNGPSCNGTTGEGGCACHACICGACCSCKCTCGRWSGVICNGTASSCSCHGNACTCRACCSCRCTCGRWSGPICPGTSAFCDCHDLKQCVCGACCACRCVCGNWRGPGCMGRPQDCECHVIQCLCNACCRCKCICGNWTGKNCDGSDNEESGCRCHELTEGEDWFPTSELQESFSNLVQKLSDKLGIDLDALITKVYLSGQGSIPSINFEVPQFLPGAGFHMRFDIEAFRVRMSSTISFFRYVMLGFFCFVMVRIFLVTFRQY